MTQQDLDGVALWVEREQRRRHWHHKETGELPDVPPLGLDLTEQLLAEVERLRGEVNEGARLLQEGVGIVRALQEENARMRDYIAKIVPALEKAAALIG